MGRGLSEHIPGEYFASVRYPNEEDKPMRRTPTARTKAGPGKRYFYAEMDDVLEIPYDENQQHVVVTVWSERGACGDIVIPLWDRTHAGMAERAFAGLSGERLPTATLEVIFPEAVSTHVAGG